MATNDSNNIKIWQWNCASFRRRKAPLQQLIRSAKVKPHVILLQETLAKEDISLPGYNSETLIIPGGRGIATLVRKDTSYETHELPKYKVGLEAQMIELILKNKKAANVFIANVYSSPADRKRDFKTLLARISNKADTAPLVVAGDFNAPNKEWGYGHQSVKGTNLATSASELKFALITDANFPTRTGTSTTRDTTPDLTFLRGIEGSWDNLQDNFRSDHYIMRSSYGHNHHQ